jgi:multidrug resistance efflux pump
VPGAAWLYNTGIIYIYIYIYIYMALPGTRTATATGQITGIIPYNSGIVLDYWG